MKQIPFSLLFTFSSDFIFGSYFKLELSQILFKSKRTHLKIFTSMSSADTKNAYTKSYLGQINSNCLVGWLCPRNNCVYFVALFRRVKVIHYLKYSLYLYCKCIFDMYKLYKNFPSSPKCSSFRQKHWIVTGTICNFWQDLSWFYSLRNLCTKLSEYTARKNNLKKLLINRSRRLFVSYNI